MYKPKAVYDYVPIYNRHVFYATDPDLLLKEIHKYFKEGTVDVSYIKADDTSHGYACPITDINDDDHIKAFAVLVRKDEAGVIAHEIAHLKNFIFAYVGQEADAINDEAEAYLIGYLTNRYLELMKGKKSGDKPLKKLKNVKR